MIVGQAPGRHEATTSHAPFSGPAGRRLFTWLHEVGWDEAEFRATQYMTAVTKCFPGRLEGGRGDRAPSAAEQALCSRFLERELDLVDPELVIPVGGLAIARFLGKGRMRDRVGKVFEFGDRRIVPLPHPSGANLWLNRPESKRLLERALIHLRTIRTRDRYGRQ